MTDEEKTSLIEKLQEEINVAQTRIDSAQISLDLYTAKLVELKSKLEALNG